MSVFGVILVRIFPAFSRILTEYDEIRSIFPYLVRMQENAGKMLTRITPVTNIFYVVYISRSNSLSWNVWFQYKWYIYKCFVDTYTRARMGWCSWWLCYSINTTARKYWSFWWNRSGVSLFRKFNARLCPR